MRPHTHTAATVTVAAFVAATAVSDTMGVAEKARVDGVSTPKPDWFPGFDTAGCATFRLPLDDDEPDGATTELAVTRVKAADPGMRIGALFVNPGGPGAATGRPLGGPASAGTTSRRLSA